MVVEGCIFIFLVGINFVFDLELFVKFMIGIVFSWFLVLVGLREGLG